MKVRIKTVSFRGVDVLDIDVEVQISSGFVAFTNVGYIKYIFLITLSMFFIKPAFADSTSGWWDKHEKEYSRLAKTQDCDGIWNLFWPEAKAGNLEARYALFIHVYFPIHNDRMTMPGHSFNYSDLIRDSLVLSIHSLGFNELKNVKESETIDKALYSQFLLPKNPKFAGPHDRFLDCVNENPSNECTKIAVHDEIVPSFEEYAKSIDILISQGAKPSCDFYPDSYDQKGKEK